LLAYVHGLASPRLVSAQRGATQRGDPPPRGGRRFDCAKWLNERYLPLRLSNHSGHLLLAVSHLLSQLALLATPHPSHPLPIFFLSIHWRDSIITGKSERENTYVENIFASMQLDRVQLPFSRSAPDLSPHVFVSIELISRRSLMLHCGLNAEWRSRAVLKEDLHIHACFDLIEVPGRLFKTRRCVTEHYLLKVNAL